MLDDPVQALNVRNRYWVSQLKVALARAERIAMKYLRDCATRVKQVHMLKDKQLIASKLVVGMTTTKAAAIQPLLQELKPSIGELFVILWKNSDPSCTKG